MSECTDSVSYTHLDVYKRQENVVGIRVVKSFVREKYENEKFKKAAQNIYKLFVKAESVLSYNNPAMLIAVYGSILMLSWLGAKAIVGGTLTTGELTSLFSYCLLYTSRCV